MSLIIKNENINEKTIDKTIELYGKEFQINKCVEELNELIKAINSRNKDEIIEEIADIILTINTLCKILSIKDEDVNSIIKYKIERIERRMNRNEWEIKHSNDLKEMCKLKKQSSIILFICDHFDLDEFNSNIHYIMKSLNNNLDKFFDLSYPENKNLNNEDLNEIKRKINDIYNINDLFSFKYKDKDILFFLEYYNK